MNIKFITYIYVLFNQNLDETVLYKPLNLNGKLLTCNFSSNCGTAPVSNQILKSHVYFDVTDIMWLNVVTGMYTSLRSNDLL